jgi:iron complex transport system ATP-binding protein
LTLLAENLSIGYTQNKQTKIIVLAANLSLAENKLTVILGANGMGKSSLLRTLAGLQTALQGEVKLHGKPLLRYTMLDRAKNISIVNTEKPSVKHLKIGEMLATARYPYTNWVGELSPTDKMKIAQALQLTNLLPLAAQPLQTLSDGQLQKAMIARGLAQDGQFLLLDEPTAHLDLLNKAAIWKIMKESCQNLSKTVLVATHDVEFALQTADEIWLLHDQQLTKGTPHEIVNHALFAKIFDSPFLHFDKEHYKFSLRC